MKRGDTIRMRVRYWKGGKAQEVTSERGIVISGTSATGDYTFQRDLVSIYILSLKAPHDTWASNFISPCKVLLTEKSLNFFYKVDNK